MVRNDDLKTIGKVLEKANSIAIIPHILADGDAIGSAAAVCHALRDIGKTAFILIEDKMPEYLKFLAADMTVTAEEAKASGKVADTALLIDCSVYDRFPLRREYFEKAGTTVCIDHHIAKEAICDYNYINPSAPATGEPVYDLLKVMSWKITPPIANAIFAAITTDTGDFQYANTTKRSHEIAATLYDCGLESYATSIALYQNESFAKVRLHAKVLEGMQTFAGGMGILATVTQDMLQDTGALPEDSEGLVGTLRNIKGVQIAALIKEQEDGKVKVSLRVKEKGNVEKISQKYGGGGHVKAAGCTFEGKTADEVADIMKKEITTELEDK